MTGRLSLQTISATFIRRDKIMLGIIALSLIAVVFGIVFLFIPPLAETGDLITSLAQTLAEWTGLILLILNGTTLRTIYWKFITVAFFIVGMAIIFIILHLPYGNGLLLLGFIWLVVVYTIRFVLKNPKGVLDWLKYLWICSWCVFAFLDKLRILDASFMLISSVIFWAAITIFVLTRLKIMGEGKADY